MLAPSMMAPEAGVGGWAAKLERREVDTRSMHQQGQCMMSERYLDLYYRMSKSEKNTYGWLEPKP